jgi:hypothetical protein
MGKNHPGYFLTKFRFCFCWTWLLLVIYVRFSKGFELLNILVFQIFVIPVLIGLLFELLVIVPMRVPVDESPVFLLYQDWALGLIFLKIWTRLVSVISVCVFQLAIIKINRQVNCSIVMASIAISSTPLCICCDCCSCRPM